ncbi:hypothetical protein ACHHYP_20678 [Achlya hypogyna]|uniref:Uncharacterized protein n=1 Tax=Achlya hypogyna TaxID=1202772 RepID=A0A1V9YFE8_ACHHY|nr:hypothetical protein ACHHYP_20678 [Achlya hypogyna]
MLLIGDRVLPSPSALLAVDMPLVGLLVPLGLLRTVRTTVGNLLAWPDAPAKKKGGTTSSSGWSASPWSGGLAYTLHANRNVDAPPVSEASIEKCYELAEQIAQELEAHPDSVTLERITEFVRRINFAQQGKKKYEHFVCLSKDKSARSLDELLHLFKANNSGALVEEWVPHIYWTRPAPFLLGLTVYSEEASDAIGGMTFLLDPPNQEKPPELFTIQRYSKWKDQ